MKQSTPDTEELILEQDGDWLTIWINRQHAGNTLSASLVETMLESLAELQERKDVRGITLRGKGTVFCAGGDLRELEALARNPNDPAGAIAASKRGGELFHKLNEMPQFVLCCLHGSVRAGGIGLAAAADLVIATRDTDFALTEVMLGLVPSQIAPLLIPRMGVTALRRYGLSGSRFDAQTAKAIGLVDECVDSAEQQTGLEIEIRQQVLKASADAIANFKRTLIDASVVDRDAVIAQAAEQFASLLVRDETQQRIRAFFDKRQENVVFQR